MLSQIANTQNASEMENFFVVMIKIYKELEDNEYMTLPTQKDINSEQDNWCLLWLINETVFYSIDQKNLLYLLESDHRKVVAQDSQKYQRYSANIFKFLLEQIINERMFTTAINLIVKSNPVLVNSEMVKSALVEQVIWRCVANNSPGALNSLKRGLKSVGYDLKPLYNVLGHQSYANFNFSGALKNFQKAGNKKKSAEVITKKF